MIIEELKKFKEQYMKNLVSNRKSSLTVDAYSYNLNRMIRYIEANFDENFDIKEVVLDYIDNLDPKYEPTTINALRTSIRSFITFLHNRSYIDEDFGGNIETLQIDSKPKEVLEPGEIADIFNVLISELKKANGYNIYFKARDLILFSFLLHTGVRRSELVKVKFDDIDLINDEIRVVGKGNKTRVIPLLADLKQHIYSFRDTLERLDNEGYNVKSEYIFRSETKNKDTNKKDMPMSPRNVAIIIDDICKKANIDKNISPHSLRHTFASYGVKNKSSNISMAEVLGHANLSTFLNIYAHEISMEEKKKEIGKIKFDL